MSCGLGRDWFWRRLILGIFGQGVQFSVSAVPFGPGIDILALLSFHWSPDEGHFVLLLGGLGRFCSLLHRR